MSTKADFSVDEWDLLRSSSLMASMLVVAASPSGPVGLVQESSATARTILQSVGTAQTPLLKALGRPLKSGKQAALPTFQQPLRLKCYKSSQTRFRCIWSLYPPTRLLLLIQEACHFSPDSPQRVGCSG
jgi:hypothetical protein